MATVIMNKAQLAAINGSSGSYELGADILDWDLPAIPSFTGELDGKGYTITGTMTKEDTSYWVRVGLFATMYGKLHDIVFKDCAINYTGESGIAGIVVARADGASDMPEVEIYNLTMINCSLTMNITVPTIHGEMSAQVGLICGYFNGSMNGCNVDDDCEISVTALTVGYCNAGMLMGYGGGNIINCGAKGTITCDASSISYAGGIGGMMASAVISNCYSEVELHNGSSSYRNVVGGIYGTPLSAPTTYVQKCYYAGLIVSGGTKYPIGVNSSVLSTYWLDSCGGSGGGGTSKTSAQLKQEATFVDWDFDTIWSIGEGSTYPILQNGALPILTLPATDVDYYKRSATFNGSSCGMSQVWFKWGGEGLENTSVKIPAAGHFSIYLHGATRGYTYYFQAVGMDAEGNLYYGDTLSFELTQSVAADAYVTKLIIRGQPLVPLETMTLVAKDDDSIAKYGKRSYSLSTQYSLNQDDTQVILNTILAANKDPRVNDLSITFQNLKPGAYKDSVIAADISTRITLINTSLGIDGDFFINNIKHTIVDAGLSYTVEWRLERVYDTTMEP